jgi:hypothetical protein
VAWLLIVPCFSVQTAEDLAEDEAFLDGGGVVASPSRDPEAGPATGGKVGDQAALQKLLSVAGEVSCGPATGRNPRLLSTQPVWVSSCSFSPSPFGVPVLPPVAVCCVCWPLPRLAATPLPLSSLPHFFLSPFSCAETVSKFYSTQEAGPAGALPVGFVGELYEYQKRGLDWLKWLHDTGTSGILADEMASSCMCAVGVERCARMFVVVEHVVLHPHICDLGVVVLGVVRDVQGLGKTVQVIAFVSYST